MVERVVMPTHDTLGSAHNDFLRRLYAPGRFRRSDSDVVSFCLRAGLSEPADPYQRLETYIECRLVSLGAKFKAFSETVCAFNIGPYHRVLRSLGPILGPT